MKGRLSGVGEFQGYIEASAEQLGMCVGARQLDLFRHYKDLLLERNKVMNLTATTDELGIAVKHFADSLTCLTIGPGFNFNSLIDIGTGAGFPGLVLKIMKPCARAVLVDSVGKKAAFVRDAAVELGLPGVEALHARAEELGARVEYREQFDLAVARGVAELGVLAEYCLPFVAVGGWFIAMKGPRVVDELATGTKACRILGGAEPVIRELALPFDAGQRVLLAIKKERPSPPQYPRKAGMAEKRPLGA